MIEFEKKIAQQTLNILMKKSWNAFSLEEVLKKVKVKVFLFANDNQYHLYMIHSIN